MSSHQFSGPLVIGGRDVSVNGVRADYNPETGPSAITHGTGILDPRWLYQDAATSFQAICYQATAVVPVLNAAPATASATALAAAQAGVSGTPLTLITASTSAVTILAATQTVYPSGTILPAGTLALDGSQGMLGFGQNAAIQEYDITKNVSRALVVTFAGNDTAANVTIAGFDLYGFPQTERISGASGATSAGKKAWKFITKATPGGTVSGSNISLGTLDVFGFPMRADEFAFADYVWDSTLGTISGFVKADITSPATSTTGDVRGTYAPPTASNGVRKLQVFITPSPNNMQSSQFTGLFGVTPA